MIIKKHKYDDVNSAGKEISFSREPSEAFERWATPVNGKGLRCWVCTTSRNPDSFPLIPRVYFGFTDAEGRPRSRICKKCLQYLLDDLTEKDPEHNMYCSLYKICAITGVYYDDETAHKIFEEELFYEDGSPVSNRIDRAEIYFRHIMETPQFQNRFFWDSNNLVFSNVLDAQKEQSVIDKMSEQTKKSRTAIITTYHRDPFENEEFNDRVQMYEDLLTMTTPDVGENLPKSRALIEIVKAYNRIDKINATLNVLQSSVDSMMMNEKSIKTLTDNKDKEQKGIAQLCKDYGLSDKHAGSGNKGIGTIGNIVREMADRDYDPGKFNRFDADTAAAMKQVADISMESIFNQLSFSSADFAGIVKKQAGVIREMQVTMAAQAEELRALKEQHIKEELLLEYENILKERGIDPVEVERIIQQQMEFKPYDTSAYYSPVEEDKQTTEKSDNIDDILKNETIDFSQNEDEEDDDV